MARVIRAMVELWCGDHDRPSGHAPRRRSSLSAVIDLTIVPRGSPWPRLRNEPFTHGSIGWMGNRIRAVCAGVARMIRHSRRGDLDGRVHGSSPAIRPPGFVLASRASARIASISRERSANAVLNLNRRSTALGFRVRQGAHPKTNQVPIRRIE
jgi:hypothetical protein